MSAMRGLFVTGTDTGVGKTRIASAIARDLTARGRRVGVLKPVATGANRVRDAWHCEDAEALISAIGGGVPLDLVAPIVLVPPLAPPVAARVEGRRLAFDRVHDATREALARWEDRGVEVVVVEGVGGLLCPIAEGATVADLAVRLDYPMVVVARRGLGTLNHTLLTVEAARLRGLRLAGVVLNGSEPTTDPIAEATNPAELSRYLGDVPILENLPYQGDPSILLDFVHDLDWYGRAALPRRVAGPARGTEANRS